MIRTPSIHFMGKRIEKVKTYVENKLPTMLMIKASEYLKMPDLKKKGLRF